MGQSQKFDRHIEGLRACAVIAVIVNHAWPSLLLGGFAGVDLFFVISGYLIGKHLIEDIQHGRLSFWNFYAKRMRRLFPALAVVLVTTWCGGWYIYSAPEFVALGRHIVASIFFANNFLLWSETGYFDALAETKPLLHLWSLGIEEQFYLLVPVMLWWGRHGREVNIFWVVRLGFLSLLACVFLSEIYPEASFYLLHSRFWELAVGVLVGFLAVRRAAAESGDRICRGARLWELVGYGAMLMFASFLLIAAGESAKRAVYDGALIIIFLAGALIFHLPTIYGTAGWYKLRTRIAGNSALLGQIASLAGAMLILIALFLVRATDWPGAAAVVPVAGAAILLALPATVAVNKLLGWKPLVFLGGISYPLYLWHWPLLVFWRTGGSDASALKLPLLMAGAVVLAWLTKVLIESPLRFGVLGAKQIRRPGILPICAGLTLAGFLGATSVVAHGLPSRFPAEVRALAEWSEDDPDRAWRVGACYFYLNSVQPFAKECKPERREGVARVLLWGDSHAAQLFTGLSALQPSGRFDIVQWTAAGCPPTSTPLIGEGGNCPFRRAQAFGELEMLVPDEVILSGAWARYLSSGDSAESIVSAVGETLSRLRGLGVKRVVLVGPGPVWKDSLAVDLFRFMVRGHVYEIPRRFGNAGEDIRSLDTAMRAVAEAFMVDYVSVVDILCNSEGCLTLGEASGPRPDLLFRDRDHLTEAGSRLVMEHARELVLRTQ